MDYIQLEFLTKIISVVLCGCVLPIVWIWMQTRRKISESRDRTQIVMAALEKNPDMEVEELVKKMAPQKKLLKEKLLTKLLWGSIFTIFGLAIYIAVLIYNIFVGGFDRDMFIGLSFAAVPSLGIGLAFLINYLVGRKVLKKEMEAEQAKLLEQA